MNETINVTLLKTHRHAGRDRAEGEAIDVTPADAAWLAAQGVIEPRTAEPNTTHRGRRRDRED